MQDPRSQSEQDHFEIYLQDPTPFILANWKKLLPDWQVKPKTIGIILLKSRFALEGISQEIELEKARLLTLFLAKGEEFKSNCQKRGFLVEVISPQDGKPQYSTPGQLTFDLVAVVNYCLGFAFSQTAQGCKMLQHPQWEKAVYPGLFLAETTRENLQFLLENQDF